MNLLRLLSILAVVLTMSLSNAFGETINSASDITEGTLFYRYLHSANYQKILKKHVAIMDVRLGVKVSRAVQVENEKTTVVVPVRMEPDDEKPARGVWTTRYTSARDGKSRTYNVGFIMRPGEESQVFPMVMGTTEAPLATMKDAVPEIMKAAFQRSKGECTPEIFKKYAIVYDTSVAAPPHDMERDGRTIRGAWSEKWVVKLADEEIPVMVMFMPGEYGGTNFAVLGQK